MGWKGFAFLKTRLSLLWQQFLRRWKERRNGVAQRKREPRSLPPAELFVAVRTDVTPRSKTYNKALCMAFEHLWGVVFPATTEHGATPRRKLLVSPGRPQDVNAPLGVRLGSDEDGDTLTNWLWN